MQLWCKGDPIFCPVFPQLFLSPHKAWQLGLFFVPVQLVPCAEMVSSCSEGEVKVSSAIIHEEPGATCAVQNSNTQWTGPCHFL